MSRDEEKFERYKRRLFVAALSFVLLAPALFIGVYVPIRLAPMGRRFDAMNAQVIGATSPTANLADDVHDLPDRVASIQRGVDAIDEQVDANSMKLDHIELALRTLSGQRQKEPHQ